MCCFSLPVNDVSQTSIFGRIGARGNQVLIYSMSLDTDEDLSMILPIPVAENTPENGIQFVNLERYEDLFEDMTKGFPSPRSLGVEPFGESPAAGAIPLKVKRVGNFDASFVPALNDFDRLDERFRLPDEVWKNLPQYQKFGFAVFKLRAGKTKVHPMAFAFPTADRNSIFFPTVHIHDGKVHSMEEFDHDLYCQTKSGKVKMEWQESAGPARNFTKSLKTKGTIRPNEHVYRMRMMGSYENRDIVVAAV